MDTLLALGAVVAGVVLLVVSADRFVTGAAETSRTLGLPPLLIGMLVIGFGSSVPEMVISGFSAAGGNPGLALGNAMGSNIANIALILGATATSSLRRLPRPWVGLCTWGSGVGKTASETWSSTRSPRHPLRGR